MTFGYILFIVFGGATLLSLYTGGFIIWHLCKQEELDYPDLTKENLTPIPGAKIKYVLCPGWLSSVIDDDFWYISQKKLIEMYKVNPRECVSLVRVNMNPAAFKLNKLIYLSPQHDGNYTLPEEDTHE